MSDRPAERAASPNGFRPRALKYAIGLAVLGAGLVLWARLTGSGLEVAYLPISADRGQANIIQFTIPKTRSYEIELELQTKDDFDKLDAAFGTTQQTPQLNLRWVISTGDETIAEGTSQQYLYLSTDWYKQRLVKWILGARHYHHIRNSRIGRGVGKFQGQAGTEYELTAMVEEWPSNPPFVDPHLVVLVDRRSRARQLTRANSLAVAGLGSLTLAAVVLVVTVADKFVR